MREKKGIISSDYNLPVHLFRDQLLEIEMILKEDLGGSDFKVSFDNFESEDISSIPEDQKQTNNISFEISNPHFNLEIRGYSIRIYAYRNLLHVKGAIAKIKEILDSTVYRGARFRFYLSKLALFAFLFIGIIGGLIFSGEEVVMEIISRSPIYSYFLIIVLLFCLLSISAIIPIPSLVEFKMKKDKNNFWKENKDRIYVGLIVGIVTIFLGYILNLYIN